MSAAPICVVTAVLNAVRDLPLTISSVLEQKSRRDLHYVIIDGGSTDGTVEVIRRFEDSLLYWVSEADGGIYDAMNKGWAAAPEGSLILFVGAGDRLISLPDDLSRYDSNDVLFGTVLYGDDVVFRSCADVRLRLYNTLHHQALLVPKWLHPLPPFDTRYRVFADFDFNQRLMKAGARFVEAPGFVAYALPGGASDGRHFSESLMVIRKNFGFLWASLAAGACAALRLFPLLKRLGPFRRRTVSGTA